MSKAGDTLGGAASGAATGAAIGSIVPGWGTAIGGIAGGLIGGIGGYLGSSSDEEERKKKLLEQFAAQGQANYNSLGTEAAAQRDYLRSLASGQNSISAEQLRQGLQQQIAAQQSIAAGANPANASAAARQASINAMHAGTNMAGQQAIAGLQERQQAQQALSNMIMQQRQQELAAAQGSQGAPLKSWIETYGPAIQGGLSSYAALNPKGSGTSAPSGAQPAPVRAPGQDVGVYSDRRLKKGIKPGDAGANKMLEGLRAFTYSYKDERHGKGERTGVMAQDLERAGIKHAVIDTPAGKMVHGGHLATANTAMLAALGRRVAKIEASK